MRETTTPQGYFRGFPGRTQPGAPAGGDTDGPDAPTSSGTSSGYRLGPRRCDDDGAMARTTTSPYSTRFKVAAVAVLTLAVAAFVGAYLATTGDGDDTSSGADEVVEERFPAPNAQVPQQSTVGVDLAAGWEGTLRIDDVEIPRDELRITPELARIEFMPRAGAAVEELRAGTNCVTAVVWPIAEGRASAREIPWCFQVV